MPSFSVGSLSIPFDQVDDSCIPWESVPPPEHLIIGREAGVLLQDGSPEVSFAGWVDLSKSSPLKRVITYGRMKGIRFVFGRDQSKCFGNTALDGDRYEQSFDGNRGEKVIGIYAIPYDDDQDEDEDDDDQITVSATSKNEASTAIEGLWVSYRLLTSAYKNEKCLTNDIISSS